ncbi:MAG: Coenzyme F420 hydrogenase/dehydrogenase, beta subunit C-terminal domain [Rikenellaceae bacterium]|nr:Coenzyme F420 hydrogenase/dehydrogenase, beta subunit C-terminal domain [Rikenellaceae bacterium]
MKLSNIVRNNLCVSCGACQYLSHDKIHLKEVKKKGLYIPTIKRELNKSEIVSIANCCPAEGYPIIELGKQIHDKTTQYDYRLGRFKSFAAYKSTSSKILKKASSGGLMTAIASYLLDNMIVQGVVSTTYTYRHDSIMPQTKIYRYSHELLETQGSKYMPVPALIILDEIEKFDGKLAFIGTPCQIASIRLLQKSNVIFKEKILFTIGNFCGGFRDMREIYRIKSIANINNENITYFQYRGEGQPGKMVFETKNSKYWEYPYPDYSKLTGYMKYYRCRVCVDATAELADISCGDAWLPRYQTADSNWSVVIIRNIELEQIINNMVANSVIIKSSLSLEDILISQKGNLLSKKERYLSRLRFLKLIGKKTPTFDGGWSIDGNSSFIFEVKVYVYQKIKYYCELIGIYIYIQKIYNKFF